MHSDNLDALQCLANLRLLRARDAEAKEILKQVVDKTMQIVAKEKQDQSLGNLMTTQASENKAQTKSEDA